MSKPILALWVGGLLGALDGLSAWFSPEARPVMLAIVIGSTIKGLVTGLLTGLIARSKQSAVVVVVAGVAIGFVLSSAAAIGQGSHYWEIVLPGMLVGALVGFVAGRHPRAAARARPAGTISGLVLVAALPGALAGANAQAPPSADPLEPVARLVGTWTGTSEGQPGDGKVERQYERVLGSRFIQVRNRSVYPPQPKNPKGETHEDIGFLSFDSARKRVVFRQFHVEGFVNQYVMEQATAPGRLVFTTEAIENIPAGFRARETYILTGADQLEEIFELAEPGKPFELYSRTRLTRTR